MLIRPELTLLVVAAVCKPARLPRDVATCQGVVRGYLAAEPPHYAYRGIPYARPAQHHRFKAPESPRPWDGIFEATHKVRCLQPDGSGTEDCLVVNVFSPQYADGLPVVVIIHGGNFQSGWGATRPPARLLAKEFVIVTFNYRVGIFGFLCLGTVQAPGNAGLKDQIAALYWVSRNIANFGGNPYDVTLYGIDSGAASIQLLLMSGLIKGMAHKVILESGSILSPLSLSYDPVLTAMDVAIANGYHGNENTNELSHFYRTVPSKNLTGPLSLFLPCIEQSFPNIERLVEKDPLEMLKSANYQKVPMIIALADKSWAMFVRTELPNEAQSFEYMLPNNLHCSSHTERTKLAEMVIEFYIGKTSSPINMTSFFEDYINDVTYKYPILKSAVLHAATSMLPVYLIKVSNEIINGTEEHKSILDYFYEDTLTEVNEMKITQLVLLWSNFIKIGDPTPLLTFLLPFVWQPLQVSVEKNQFDLKVVNGLLLEKSATMSYDVCDDRTIFWDRIYKKFYRTYTGFHYLDDN